jgi:hypothetical protein
MGAFGLQDLAGKKELPHGAVIPGGRWWRAALLGQKACSDLE